MVFRSIEKSNKHKILKAKNWVAFKIEEEIKHDKINIGNTIMPCCEERLVTKPCCLGMQKNVNKLKDKQMYRMSFIYRSQFMDLGEIEEAT